MVTVTLTSGKTFESAQNMSILAAAAKEKITMPHSCKTGRCSTCKCKVIKGDTKPLAAELGISKAEKAEGWILSCVRTAETDIILEVEDLGGMRLPQARTQPCRISSLDKLGPDVTKVVLRLPPNTEFCFVPGQYIDVIGPGSIRRSYSIANAPRGDNTLELHIKAVDQGVMSQYWFGKSAVNDLLRLHGPQGTFFLRDVTKRDLIFLATGTGLAPIKAMLENLPSLAEDQKPQSITFLWGARQEDDLYFDVANKLDIPRYIPVLSRADAKWQGARGYVQDTLLRRIPDLQNAAVYACGSAAMIQSSKSALTAAGLPLEYFYSDAFVCSATHIS
jgi:CDP-4-dehydro-6-deoxyglucose reductase